MKKLIFKSLASLIVFSLSSRAAVYFVQGIEYDITTFNTTWHASSGYLTTQPWWGSSQAARDFAAVVGPTLGGQLPGSAGNPSDGPYFAFSTPTGQGPAAARLSSGGTIVSPPIPLNPAFPFTYAQAVVRGGSQQFPILPTIPTFLSGPSGRWFDPPAASGFDFTMTSGSLFTSILNFPTGIDGDNSFQVWVNDQLFGNFNVGESVNFGAGVSSFRITGIDPSVDGGDPMAFPIQLEFDTPSASFTMVPIPETSSALLAAASGVMLLGLRRRASV